MIEKAEQEVTENSSYSIHLWQTHGNKIQINDVFEECREKWLEHGKFTPKTVRYWESSPHVREMERKSCHLRTPVTVSAR